MQSSGTASGHRFIAPRSALVALLSVLACACYPEFRFGEGEGGAGASSAETSASRASVSSSGGQGGDPATTSSTTTTTASTTTSTTSTGTTTPLPELSCNDGGTAPVACAPGDRCCFDESTPTLDKCSAGACGANQLELRCDGPEDCPGQVCCARMHLSQFLQEPRFDGPTECVTTCSTPNHVVCHGPADCGGGACVPLFDGSYTYYAPEYAQAYRVCLQ